MKSAELSPFPVKAQWVRVADVVFIGPIMMWAGVKITRSSPIAGRVLFALGAGTVAYNAYNWWRIRNRELSRPTLPR
jgi:hypothetical protein